MKLNVTGMHCEKCVERITKGKVSLEENCVYLEDESKMDEMVELLDDLGFEASR